MFRRSIRREMQHTEPDHCPMLPELRTPGDPVDAAVRSVRRRYDELNPIEYLKWR